MRGGSEIIDPPPEVLLEGAYMTEDQQTMYSFVVTQTDPDSVIIRRQILPRNLNYPGLLPPIQLTMREYREQFLPVVDSGANNDNPIRFTIHGTIWTGSWWSIARLLETPAGNAGGKHQRKRSGKSGHKRSGHKRSGHKRSGHKNKSHRRRRH
jgi:hypothetical protein